MIQIGHVIVHADCLTENFCCDLEACKGACCIEGDAGAPITLDELAELEAVLPEIEEELDPEARKIIHRQGVAYTDVDGDLVTSIVRGRDCVFTCYGKENCCYCAVERAHREGRSSFCKPISCYLYPIRASELGSGIVALNYHRWNVCKDAVKKGNELHLPVYKFLKDPLIRRFGEAWYAELEETVEALKEQGYLQ
ncbi:MAG: DUF3109 family protein [Bacteroidaceae bacterium]